MEQNRPDRVLISETRGETMDKKAMFSMAKSVEDQIFELQDQVRELSRVIAAKAGEARDEAAPMMDAAAGTVRSAARSVRHQGQQVVDTVRENPGAASSVAVTAGVIGLVVGYLVASASQSNGATSRWRF
jgi:ElaB/YqjD/DUF883 family membrane-anchored ribosome-binding protein